MYFKKMDTISLKGSLDLWTVIILLKANLTGRKKQKREKEKTILLAQ